MRCDEFEQFLQQQADGCGPDCDEAALRQHAQGCRACRELEDGFRLVCQAFTTSRILAPSPDLASRIVDVIAHDRESRLRLLRRVLWLAAAAGVLVTIGIWGQRGMRNANSQPTISNRSLAAVPDARLPMHHSASDELLFPELASSDGVDHRDGVVLVEAVEPVSEIFRAVGRSLGGPVRPIATAASDALGSLFSDLPEPDFSSLPGMREMMPAPMMKKKMPEMRSSSESS